MPNGELPSLSRRGLEVAPLSSAQTRLWLLWQLEPSSAAYSVARSYHLYGPLSVGFLEQSLSAIVRRHESLRTTFHLEGERPVQRVRAEWTFALTFVDLGELPESEQQRRVDDLLAREAERPFDLTCDLLLRASLVRCATEHHVLIVSQHHIATDRWSVGNLHRELSALYEAFVTGAPARLAELPLQYGDFAAWQREHEQSPVVQQKLTYWQQQLASAPPFLELPTDHPQPAEPTMAGNFVVTVLPPHVVEPIRRLGQTHRATPFMTLLTAVIVLLHRHTGIADLVVGSPAAGRLGKETESLIGFFANTLVLRIDASGDPTFTELLQRVRRVALEAYDHQEVPFERLVEALNPVRDTHSNPLVQVLVAYQNVPAVPLTLHDVQVEDVGRHTKVAPFHLELTLNPSAEGLRLRAAYQAERFERATIERLLTHLRILMTSIVQRPTEPISRLALLDDQERAQIDGFGRGRIEAGPQPGETIDRLVAEQVALTPAAVAIVDGDARISFLDLDTRATRLASRLRRCGVTRGHHVAIYLPRCADALVTMLGILKAGAGYVPLDPRDPPHRHSIMLEATRPSAIVTANAWRRGLSSWDGPIVSIDDDLGSEEPDPARPSEAGGDDHAYVLFTSGSTGRPKGVAMPHAALVNLVTWHQRHERLGRSSRTLQFAPFSFDVSFQEIFTTWCTGGSIVLVDDDTRRDPHALLRTIEEARISRLYMPFVALRQLAGAAARTGARAGALEDIISAGEVLHLPEDIRAFVASARDCRLHNHYGPTETHVVTAMTLPLDTSRWPSTAPLGQPIDGVTIHVLDPASGLAPIGVPGEIVIGGVCLAKGYVGQVALTAERFVQMDGDARVYRTGDLGRWRADGTLEFLGRLDNQVKIRGVRVEPGEVEAVLAEHPAVSASAVDARRSESGDLNLVAYVVVHDGTSFESLRTFLRDRLPEAYVPSRFVGVAELPRTSSGKVDRARLPDSDVASERTTPAAARPLSDTETTLLKIWRETLRHADIRPGDNFFDLGGHSLLAVTLFSRIEDVFGHRLPLSTLFRHPTVTELSRELDRSRGAVSWTPLVPIVESGSQKPLFLVHGIGGEVFTFRPLAKRLVDRPVYGIEAAGPGSGVDMPASLDRLAERYADEVASIEPAGPYYVGGYSSGGVLALALAQELCARGKDVALLVVFDGGMPGRARPALRPRRHTLLSLLRQLAFWVIDDACQTPRSDWLNRITSKARVITSRRAGATTEDADIRDVLGMWRFPKHYERELRRRYDAFLTHVPRHYSGRTLIIRSRTGRLLAPPVSARDDGWRDLLRGPFEIKHVPGSHHNLLHEPFVQHVARVLEPSMMAAEQAAAVARVASRP